MKTLAYLRKSTKDKQHISFEMQKAEIEKKCKVDKIYTDEVSGGANIEKKAGLLKCLEDLRKGDTLAIYRYDRLMRKVMEHCWIDKEVKKRGASIVSVSEESFGGDDPTSILMRQISACFAEFERSVIKKRTKDALAAKKSRGEKTGGKRPYSYSISTKGGRVKMLEPCSDEMKVVRDMKAWKESGMTYHGITDRLNDLEVLSAIGGKWHYTSVYRVMNRLDMAVD